MKGTSEKRSVDFLNWESCGRGYRVWPFPVSPVPPLRPLRFHDAEDDTVDSDDGRKPTFFSSTLRRLSERLAPKTPAQPRAEQEEESPEIFMRSELIELQAHLPAELSFDPNAYGRLFTSLSVCAEPLAFELIGTADGITAQFVIHPKDERLVRRQFEAFMPDVVFAPARAFLAGLWDDSTRPYWAAVEFGLGREFMIPIQAGGSDPFVGLVGALSEIEADEIGLFQVIFTSVTPAWHESIIRSVTHADGSALFVNAPELLPRAVEKTSMPLFAAVVRVAVLSSNHDRTWEIACNLAGALGAYGAPRGNELVPLQNDEYPANAHDLDVLRRETHRSGMILNAAELAGFVHLPSSEVRSPRLRRASETTKAAPAIVQNPNGLRLGTNAHAGTETAIVLTKSQRAAHVYAIGATGTGKSTLLYNLILQDIENGEGVSVLDPHGDLIDRILGVIPEQRIGDVVLLDPSDEESVVGFNILSAQSDWEKSLLASDLVSVFRRLSDAWGHQLNSVLSNALLAFMESERGGTLLDVRRFLLEPSFRNDFLKTVRDQNVVYYWRQAFPMLTGNRSVGPVVTRLDSFLSPKPIRYMVGQRQNKIDFRDIMDSGKIFLAKLSQGAIGKENSHLLGSLLVAKIQGEAMSRQRQSEEMRRHHWLYADEFHDFLTPSLAECLSGVRKYRLGLVLSHQNRNQVAKESDVASAVLNAHTRIVFRVNDTDARSLESGFSSFSADDLQNLSIGHAVCRVERSDCDFNLAVDLPTYPDKHEARAVRDRVIATSRKRYGTPHADVERMLASAVEVAEPISRSEKRPTRPEITLAQPEAANASEVPEPPQVVRMEEKPRPMVPATDLGKGGAQHKAIQDRLKDEAEKLGFRAVIEKQVLDGAGEIDLVLTRDDLSIACEVSVTQTVDYEVGNVVKCLKAGYTRIVLVSPDEEKLKKLAAAVSNSLGEEKAERVGYLLPDAFVAKLRAEPREKAEPAVEVRTRGNRTVRTVFVAISPEEAKAKEEQALKLMAALMRKKKRSG